MDQYKHCANAGLKWGGLRTARYICIGVWSGVYLDKKKKKSKTTILKIKLRNN